MSAVSALRTRRSGALHAAGFGGSDREGQREPSVQRVGQSIVTIRSLLEFWRDGVKPGGVFMQMIDGHSSGDERVDDVAQAPGPLRGFVGLRGEFPVGVTSGIDEGLQRHHQL